MKTIKVKSVSAFHGGSVSQSFRLPAVVGDYYRRCASPCDYKKNKFGIAMHCGCGFPVNRTIWEVPSGWSVYADWTDNFQMDCGDNNIVIHLESKN